MSRLASIRAGNKLDHLAILACAVAGRKSDQVRDALSVGKHPVDVVLRLRGALELAEPSSYTRKHIDAAAVLGAILARVKADVRADLIRAVSADVLSGRSACRDQGQALLDSCTVEQETPRRGALTGTLQLQVLGSAGQKARIA